MGGRSVRLMFVGVVAVDVVRLTSICGQKQHGHGGKEGTNGAHCSCGEEATVRKLLKLLWCSGVELDVWCSGVTMRASLYCFRSSPRADEG